MKKFLSVILAALILVCPLCGFATEAPETLEWYFFCDDSEPCDPWIYSYKGSIGLGKSEVKFTEGEYNDYYTFNAENAGYYYVKCSENDILWLDFPEEIKDGKAFGEAEGYFISESECDIESIIKLDAGETVLGIDFRRMSDPEETYEFEIDYLGSEITDIVIEEEALENLILDVDLLNNDGSYTFTDVDVVFSGGKTITVKNEWLELYTDTYSWVKGENNATIDYMNFSKNVVVHACEMSDVITDVEFVNFDEYKDVITTFDEPYAKEIYGAELVFTLADGNKINFSTEYEESIEINGRSYYPYAYYSYNGAEDVDIKISVSGIIVETFDCDVTKSSYIDGSGLLLSCIGDSLKDSFYYSRVAFTEFMRMYDAEDFEDTLYDTLSYFNLSFEKFINCFRLLETFMNYYF